MVSQQATSATFESEGGLLIEIQVRVTDPKGDADLVTQDIMDGVESLIQQEDAADLAAELAANVNSIVVVRMPQILTNNEVSAILGRDLGDECDRGCCGGGF
jgi:hypothetical protein